MARPNRPRVERKDEGRPEVQLGGPTDGVVPAVASELLEAFRAGEGVDVIRELVRLVMGPVNSGPSPLPPVQDGAATESNGLSRAAGRSPPSEAMRKVKPGRSGELATDNGVARWPLCRPVERGVLGRWQVGGQ